MKTILIKIKNSFFQNIFSIIFLQVIALLIFISYFFIPQLKFLFEFLANAKAKFGVILIMFTTGFSGGVVPDLLNYIFKKNYLIDYKKVFMQFLFWFYKGFEINLFYTLLAIYIGNSNNFSIVFTKVLIDEFLYTPFWAVPTMLFCYGWIEKGKIQLSIFSEIILKVKQDYFVVLLLNWIIWIPSVAVVYSLPLLLQMPIQNIILMIWGILIVFFAKK